MRHRLIAAMTLVAGLLAPALASAQILVIENATTDVPLTISIYAQNDAQEATSCTTRQLGVLQQVIITRSDGTCSGFTTMKVRARAQTFNNKPSCWAYDVPWGSQLSIGGSRRSIKCNRTQ
ncbi:MAG: hypothetical protein AB7P02_31570 [Alphaproteobacteria bacterium]